MVVFVGLLAGCGTPMSAPPGSTPCVRETQNQGQLEPATAIGTGPVHVVVIGDSYTSFSRTVSWTAEIAKDRSWSVNPFGFGGTGFTNPGPCLDNTFSTRLPAVRAEVHPDLILLQGGMNDIGASDELLRSSSADTITQATELAPVVVIGPPAAPARAAGTKRVDEALRDVCAQLGVQYVSTQAWPLSFGPDQIHLDRAGYVDFGRRAGLEILRG